MKLGTVLYLTIATLAQALAVDPQYRGIEIGPEGIVIPPDSPAGLYHISFSQDSTKILNVTFEADAAPADAGVQRRHYKQLEARQGLPINYYRCFDGLDGSDYGGPKNDFINSCNAGAWANPFSTVARVGRKGTVVWMCNKANVPNRCFGGEYQLFEQFMDIQCGGFLRGGFADVDVFFKSYGRTRPGQPFCS